MHLCERAPAQQIQSRVPRQIRDFHSPVVWLDRDGHDECQPVDDIENTLDSVGAPLDRVSFAIVDDAGERVARRDRSGQVIVSSPWAIRGYDDLPELNAQVFKDGYFYTGDLGVWMRRGVCICRDA